MTENSNNKEKNNSKTMQFKTSLFSTLQYVKIIYADANNKLNEVITDVKTIDDELIRLTLENQKDINVKCPIGIVLKFVTREAIFFAKTILKEVKKINNKILFTMDTPKKTIRQQNRKYCRIALNRFGVISIDDKKGGNETYIVQSVNMSLGGILLSNTESILNDDEIKPKFNKDEHCHIVLFIEENFLVKLHAKYVRCEYINDVYRYALQFVDMPQKYLKPLNKYITKEQIKSLKENTIKSFSKLI